MSRQQQQQQRRRPWVAMHVMEDDDEKSVSTVEDDTPLVPRQPGAPPQQQRCPLPILLPPAACDHHRTDGRMDAHLVARHGYRFEPLSLGPGTGVEYKVYVEDMHLARGMTWVHFFGTADARHQIVCRIHLQRTSLPNAGFSLHVCALTPTPLKYRAHVYRREGHEIRRNAGYEGPALPVTAPEAMDGTRGIVIPVSTWMQIPCLMREPGPHGSPCRLGFGVHINVTQAPAGAPAA